MNPCSDEDGGTAASAVLSAIGAGSIVKSAMLASRKPAVNWRRRIGLNSSVEIGLVVCYVYRLLRGLDLVETTF